VQALPVSVRHATVPQLCSYWRTTGTPIETLWGEANGTCNLQLNSNVSFFFSAIEILTDWSLALLPAILLWNVQMKGRVKTSVAIILALASA
jgi:hypothetical protein